MKCYGNPVLKMNLLDSIRTDLKDLRLKKKAANVKIAASIISSSNTRKAFWGIKNQFFYRTDLN